MSVLTTFPTWWCVASSCERAGPDQCSVRVLRPCLNNHKACFMCQTRFVIYFVRRLRPGMAPWLGGEGAG